MLFHVTLAFFCNRRHVHSSDDIAKRKWFSSVDYFNLYLLAVAGKCFGQKKHPIPIKNKSILRCHIMYSDRRKESHTVCVTEEKHKVVWGNNQLLFVFCRSSPAFRANGNKAASWHDKMPAQQGCCQIGGVSRSQMHQTCYIFTDFLFTFTRFRPV